jgi:hypothetical protein
MVALVSTEAAVASNEVKGFLLLGEAQTLTTWVTL